MRYIVPNDDKVRTIPLGRMGENLYTEIAFDISAWQSEYTIDSIVLFMLRAQDAPDSAYPATLTIEGNYAVHVLTSTDLEYIGTGKCQLQMTSGRRQNRCSHRFRSIHPTFYGVLLSQDGVCNTLNEHRWAAYRC